MLGTTIAHYKITARIGKGGMGEVYRATDTKLDREVAIKVMPQSVAQDKERLARFEREAKVLAQLNHPNIAGVYGLEFFENTQAIILELVEGDDLSLRLKSGPMPLDETCEICKQIAEALEAAHERGIIHRDLKPGNIKIRKDGKIKVLDFGLAKALSVESDLPASYDPEDSPTITDDFTKPGTILGTAAYMSPEQARGKPLDHRTDIWALGCVLFECLTGKKAFPGEDVSDTLARIIRGEPVWSILPQTMPITIGSTLRKCLEKDPRQRMQHAGDVRVDLQNGFNDSTTTPITGPFEESPNHKTAKLIVALVTTAFLAAMVGWYVKPSRTQPPPEPLDVQITLDLKMFQVPQVNPLTLSPDSQWIVYSVDDPRTMQSPLKLHSVAGLPTMDIPGTESGTGPFFSPDGKDLGFLTFSAIKSVPLSGGPARTITQANYVLECVWGEQDQIVFVPQEGGLMLVSSLGGNPKELTTLHEGELKHLQPRFLPGAEHIVFSVLRSDPHADDPDTGSIEIVSIHSKERRVLKKGIRDGFYLPSGHIVFSKGEAFFAQKMSPSTLKLDGAPTPIKDYDNVMSVSSNGTLVYRPASLEPERNSLHWITTDGVSSQASSHHGTFKDFSLSPDAKNIAIAIEGDIHIIDLETDTLKQLTYTSYRELSPSWLPDSKHVTFVSFQGNQQGLRQQPIDFSSQASPIIEHLQGLVSAHISKDHKLTVSVSKPESGVDLLVADLNNVSEIQPWLATKNTEHNGRVSPMGEHWIAYDAIIGSSRDVFVRSYTNPEIVQRISTNGGGVHPKWSADGKYLFYEYRKAIFSVSIESNERILTASNPEKLIDLPSNAVTYGWDVAPDGRFLVMTEGEKPLYGEEERPKGTKINLKYHWFTEVIKATGQGPGS